MPTPDEGGASRPCRFNPVDVVLGTHWTGKWVGPRASLDDRKIKKSLRLSGTETRFLGHAARSLFVTHTELSRLSFV
jgi:hypothetical protein